MMCALMRNILYYSRPESENQNKWKTVVWRWRGGLPENILKGDKEISVSIRVGKVITEFWILS